MWVAAAAAVPIAVAPAGGVVAMSGAKQQALGAQQSA